MLRSLACAATCLLLLPAAAGARPQRTVHAQPTSAGLLREMLAAADEWWTAQGSQPPCAGHALVTWGTVGDYSGYASSGSCTIELSPHWWSVQYRYLTSRVSLAQRRRIAAVDLALIMHERGHNIGYGHIPGTVMQAETPVVPGWAWSWAARTIR